MPARLGPYRSAAAVERDEPPHVHPEAELVVGSAALWLASLARVLVSASAPGTRGVELADGLATLLVIGLPVLLRAPFVDAFRRTRRIKGR